MKNIIEFIETERFTNKFCTLSKTEKSASRNPLLLIHETFQNGLAQCRKNDNAGLIDINGNLLFPMKYDHVGHFYNHPIAVVVLDKKKFYFNKNGDVIAPVYQ